VSAALPLITALVAVGGMLWVGKNRAEMVDATEALSLLTATGLWLIALTSMVGTFSVTIFMSALGAIVTGSGFTFRPFGAVLVNARGARASRVRALWRAVVTWTPMGVALILVKTNPSPPAYSVGLLAIESALVIGFGAAAAWAITHPSRSLQDRLAGTWIVPR
jgi:hypothetical protein